MAKPLLCVKHLQKTRFNIQADGFIIISLFLYYGCTKHLFVMKHILPLCLCFFLLLSFSATAQKKIVLWNKANERIAYIDHNNMLYLLKTRQQVAYLIASNEPDVLDAYNLEGSKIGFYREGVLYNNQKHIAAFLPEAMQKLERAMAADKAIQGILMDLQIYGWVSIGKFLKGEEN